MSGSVILAGVFTIIVLIVVALVIVIRKNAGKNTVPEAKEVEEAKVKTIRVSIMTDKGEILAELHPALMPYTVANFMNLVDRKFYDGHIFHRVEIWVIQGGDPTGTGSGGPGYTIKLQVNNKLKNVRGAIAMARQKEPNTAGSQFYILKRDAASLNGKYAVFGKVIKGMDVVDKIQVGDRMIEVKEL